MGRTVIQVNTAIQSNCREGNQKTFSYASKYTKKKRITGRYPLSVAVGIALVVR